MLDYVTRPDSDERTVPAPSDEREPMTAAERTKLEALAREANVAFDGTLTRTAASRRIEELQRATWRGVGEAGTDLPRFRCHGSVSGR